LPYYRHKTFPTQIFRKLLYVCVLVMLGGGLLGSCLQIAAEPANNITSPLFALKFKGQDTPMSACQYYKAIGAVNNCGPAGELIEPSFNFNLPFAHFGSSFPRIGSLVLRNKELPMVFLYHCGQQPV